jgi:transcriptional regulator with XRE-family HTH domain
LTIGVEGFVGERLTEAREARGIMTKSALADLLELSVKAVSHYENNIMKPRHETVSRMSQQLRVKEAFSLYRYLARSAIPYSGAPDMPPLKQVEWSPSVN